MDSEYLKNIAGSPHTEGFESRIGARIKSGAKDLYAPVGGAMESQEYTLVRSAFNNFLRRIQPTINDFAKNEDRLRGFKPGLTPEQIKIVDSIMELYNMMNPTRLKNAQYQNVLNPPNISRNPTLKEMVEEGAFTREIPLNQAWMQRDANAILSAYLRDLQGELNRFHADIKNLTGKSPTRALQVLNDTNPLLAKILQTTENVANRYRSNVKMPAGAVPSGKGMSPDPNVPSPSPQQATTTTTAPPTPVTGTSAPPSTTSNVPSATPPTSGNAPSSNQSSGNEQWEKNDFAKIILMVVDEIIKKVKSDQRSEKFMNSELPVNWFQPSLTHSETPIKEIEEPLEPEDSEDDSDDEEIPEKLTGEFLYDFHARFSKNKTDGAIVLTDKDIEFKESNGKTKEIGVIWQWKRKNENIIVVKHSDIDPTKKDEKNPKGIVSKPGLVRLFKFWDDQVTPQMGTSHQFSIPFLLKQSNPHGADMLSGADPKLINEINSRSEPLFRALYATVFRKAMEFKAKEIPLEWSAGGIVNRKTKKGYEPLSDAELHSKLTTGKKEARERWIRSLQAMKPNFFDVRKDFSPTAGFMNWAKPTGASSPTTPSTPSIASDQGAQDAVLALQKLKFSGGDAIKAVKKAFDNIGPGKSAEEYTKAAMALPKEKPVAPTPSAAPSDVSAPVSAPVSNAPSTSASGPEPTSPVSKSASGPEPTSPVSKSASGPEPTAPVSAPVSKPEEPKVKKKKVSDVEEDNGTLYWTKPNGEKIPISSKQAAQLIKVSPHFKDAMEKKGLLAKYSPQPLKEKYTRNGYVNPWQKSNLLY